MSILLEDAAVVRALSESALASLQRLEIPPTSANYAICGKRPGEMPGPHADVDHVRQAIEAGADAYLMKPFDSASMGAAFAQITFRQNQNFSIK